MDSGNDFALLNACVLGRLFEFLDIDSLKSSRLVCRTWNTFAGSSLRKRSVTKFHSLDKIPKFKKLYSAGRGSKPKVFKNFYVNFKYGTRDRTQNVADLLTVFRTTESIEFALLYGVGLDDKIINALLQLPDLVSLTLTRLEANILTSNPFGTRRFSKLKCCSLSFVSDHPVLGDANNDFVIHLLHSCENTLRSLQLRNLASTYYPTIFEVVNLRGLTHLQLEFDLHENTCVNFLKMLPMSCPNLQKFDCSFPPETMPSELIAILEYLTTVPDIRIHKYRNLSSREDNFMRVIPALGIVKTFALDTLWDGDVGEFPSCLPKVRKLKLQLIQPACDGWKTMDYLEELSIDEITLNPSDYRASNDLAEKYFPRLTKLEIKLYSREAKYIFANLKNLKELIIMKGSFVTDADITGIPVEKLHKGDETDMERSDPYIGELTSLQVLHIGSRMITSVSLTYGISKINTLTSLAMRGPGKILRSVVGGGDSVQCFYKDVLKGSYCFDLKPLMLPQLPYLVELILFTDWGSHAPVDQTQLEEMRMLRSNFICVVKYEHSKPIF